MRFDWLIVGAGFSGAVLAERIASQLGQRVLIVDRRDHIAGNAYDYYDEHGILVHKYGPHIFHTNDKGVFEYLSQFTDWRPYHHHVLGVVDGRLVPIPFNLNSLYALFPPRYAQRLEEQLVEQYGFNTKVPILKLRESASTDIKYLADYIYKNVFEGYTLKQWGVKPEELGPSVTGRVPVYIGRDDRYFQDSFQSMPKLGYTEMFRRMIAHKNIKVLLNTDYREIVDEVTFDRMIYTGPIDSFFDHMHGHLPYRSLRFEFEHVADAKFQAVGQINYPNEQAFTRITEFKHLTGQNAPGSTIVHEYSQAYVEGTNEPYYPFPTELNQTIASKYAIEIERLRGTVVFLGRLAEYKYYNMDQAAARALMIFKTRIAEPTKAQPSGFPRTVLPQRSNRMHVAGDSKILLSEKY